MTRDDERERVDEQRRPAPDTPRPDASPTDAPEGRTPEKPATDELGARGTPGAGLTPRAPHAADADLVEHGEAPADAAGAVAHHDAATHMDAHTTLSDDDHGHAEPRVGPVDWRAWGYAALGIAAGGIVLVLFWLASAA